MGLSSPIDEIEVTEGTHLAFMEDVAQRFVSLFVAVPRNVDDSETDHAFDNEVLFTLPSCTVILETLSATRMDPQ